MASPFSASLSRLIEFSGASMRDGDSSPESPTVIATEFGPLVLTRAMAFDGDDEQPRPSASEATRRVRGRIRPRPASV